MLIEIEATRSQVKPFAKEAISEIRYVDVLAEKTLEVTGSKRVVLTDAREKLILETWTQKKKI